MIYVCGIFLIFYFVPAISIYVRLFDHGSAKYFGQFVFLLPYYGYYVVFRVLEGVFKHISEEKVIKNRSLISNYFIAYKIWKEYVPIMFATIGLIIIENSNAIKHKYRRTSNSYREYLISDLEQKCA